MQGPCLAGLWPRRSSSLGCCSCRHPPLPTSTLSYCAPRTCFCSGMSTWEVPLGYGRSKPDVMAYGRDVQVGMQLV